MTSYVVTRHAHGITISAPVPVDDLLALARLWERRRGYDWQDHRVAAHLGVAWAATSRKGSDAWRAELGIVTAPGDARTTSPAEGE